MKEPLLQVRNVKKSFGGVHALKGVSLEVYPQEILALVGENGAGKSTLAKILSGVLQLDEGTIEFGGKPVSFHGTLDAQKAGIAIVLQEFNLIPHLSIAENIFLTHREMYKKGIWLDSKLIREKSELLFERLQLDFHLDPSTKILNLSIAEQQIVEILKALAVNAKLLILDEPTATLSRQEVNKLFGLMQTLRNQGMTLIFVSHRLEEIFEISDRIVVFRDGEKVRESPSREITEKDLISSMVGRDIGDLYTIRNRQKPGEVVLEVKNLCRGNRVVDCSFIVRRGEVVGISGLVGAGRTELLRTIFGADKPDRGEIVLRRRVGLLQSPLDSVRQKIGMIPEDRKTQGVLLNLPIYQNITLSYLAREKSFWIRRKQEEQMVASAIQDLSIRTPSMKTPVGSLSGGNQQKVVVAKWLLTAPDIILMDEPSRGIDIGAKFELYQLIDRLAAQGIAVVLVSSELPEILALSDRILVMHHGRIVKELDPSEASEEIILSYSALGNLKTAAEV
jgi:ABC-type sugar transport system ATPase subunit